MVASPAKIPILGSDFNSWTLKFENFAILHGYADFIEASLQNNIPAVNQEETPEHKKKNQLFAAMVATACQTKALLIIRKNRKDGIKMLREIRAKFNRHDAASTNLRWAEFIKMRIKEDEDPEQFFDKLELARFNLQKSGLEISDEQMRQTLITAVSIEKYKMLIGQLYNYKTEEEVKIQIQLFHETMDKFEKDKPAPELIGLSTKIKCKICHKDHFFTNCPQYDPNYVKEKKWRKKKKKKKKARSANRQQSQQNNNDGEPDLNVARANIVEEQQIIFRVDSGATCNLLKDNILQNAQPTTAQVTGIKSKVKATHKGDIHLRHSNGTEVIIKNCFYSPEAKENLLSTGMMENQKIFADVLRRRIDVPGFEQPIPIAFKNLEYTTTLQPIIPKMKANIATHGNWHKRLGHPCQFRLREFSKQFNVPMTRVNNCETCLSCKSVRTSYHKLSTNRSTTPGERTCTDVTGPKTRSLNDAQYAINFVDDCSNFVDVYLMKNKSDAPAILEQHLSQRKPPSILRSDNGGEYTSKKFNEILVNNKIKHETSCPHTPEQNGLAENTWKQLSRTTTCMLNDSNLPPSFWDFAMCYAAYTRNRTPCSSNPDNKTPYETMFNKKPDISRIKVFGCKAFVHKVKKDKKTFSPNAYIGTFVGIPRNQKGYLVYVPELKRIVTSNNVKFDETEKGPYEYNPKKKTTQQEDTPKDGFSIPVYDPTLYLDFTQTEDQEEQESIEQELNQEAQLNTISGSTDDLYIDMTDVNLNANRIELIEPTSRAQAMRENPEIWQKAEQEEIQALKDLGTWEVIPKSQVPDNKKPIRAGWNYRIKRNENNEITRFKARLHAKGCTQTPGLDYEDTYSPVMMPQTLRILLAVSAQRGYAMKAFDFANAYLRGDLDKEIYMSNPPGYKIAKSNQVLKLVKPLYGLKQSGRQWFIKVAQLFKDNQWTQSKIDPCLFIKDNVYALIYVDDIAVFGPTEEAIDQIMDHFVKNEGLRDEGKLSFFLGLEIESTKDCIRIHQKNYIKNKLLEFEYKGRAYITPGPPGKRLQADTDKRTADIDQYTSLNGSLLYLANKSRPDIAFQLKETSKYIRDPRQVHKKALEHLLGYLSRTSDYCLTFERNQTSSLIGYADSDYAGDKDTRRSTTGYVFTLNGTAISWSSKTQSIVAQSSSEAEINALNEGSREAKFLRNLIKDIDPNLLENTTPIYCDNSGALLIAKGRRNHNRTKHFDIRLFALRDTLKQDNITIRKIDTKEQAADLLTKNTSKAMLDQCTKRINLR